MASWYRDGTISVSNGSTSVTGVGTIWVSQVSPGDLVTFDAGQRFYEVASVASNTSLTLATAYAGTTLSGAAYAVVRNFTSTLPAQLASEVADLVQSWQTREDEMGDWMAGPSNGGPAGDGKYPLTDPSGTTRTVTGLARLSEIVGAVNGKLSKSVAGGGAHTLTASEASNGILELTGALTGNKQVVVPAEARSWIVLNKTTGSYTLTVKTATGTGIVVSQGYADVLVCDGTNVLRADSDFANVALTGTPTAPTAATGTANTQIATTAFALALLQSFGFGTQNAPTVTNLDEVKTAGIYTTTGGATGVPESFGVTLVLGRNGTASGSAFAVVQVFFGGTAVWTRSLSNSSGSWTTWTPLAKLDSPAFTGSPTAPTPTFGDDSTKLATTGFVMANSFVYRGTLGGAGVDLNYITGPGVYCQQSSSNAAAGGNYPIATSGWLTVYTNPASPTSGPVQTYISSNQNRMFTRGLLSGTWSSWKEIASTAAATDTAAGLVELATSAEVQAGTDTSRAVTPAGLRSALSGPLYGLRNLLINPTFSINQRGYTSGSATTSAAQYTYDRWRVVVSGQSVSLSGETLTAPAGGVEQVVEGGNIGTGTYVLNWTGTATATINGSAVAKGGTVNLTTGTNATVRFSGGTVTKPQLEPGAVATAFDRRPMPVELALCLYYSRRVTHDLPFSAGARSAYNLNGYVVVNLPGSMRTTPTIFPGVVSNAGAPYILSASPTGFVIGAAANNAGLATMAGFFADAEIY